MAMWAIKLIQSSCTEVRTESSIKQDEIKIITNPTMFRVIWTSMEPLIF